MKRSSTNRDVRSILFLEVPFIHKVDLQATVLILNTVVLIVALIVFEFFYADAPKEEKKHLKFYYPYGVLAIGLLAFSILRQAGGQ